MADAEGRQPREFRAEVRKVLQILTNSLYTNKEIFLRELVSNASDALDKLRFRQSSGEVPAENSLPLEIRVTTDQENNKLIISDTGIGMTEEELADNLGIIARSGSESFLSELAAHSAEAGKTDQPADASQIIGRFGVGFYSVFMVASKVEVYSRPAFGDSHLHVWESDGLGTYTVSESDNEKPRRGTRIVIHLKEDASEYSDAFRVNVAIKKHSGFVPFPVYVNDEKVNTQPALWREPKSSVTAEQYKEFYKSFAFDSKDPIDWLHINVDSPVQFQALLYIPDIKQEFRVREEDLYGLDLYSRRVLIQHKNKDLIPVHLGFLTGVVDTEDLPLNISRETLQENHVLRKIRQVIVKQTLTHLEKMAEGEPEKYLTFWNNHGTFIKFGLQDDYANRERLLSLVRFNSSSMDKADELTSLDDYMGRAAEGQKTFWFLSAPNREAAKVNPYFGRFRRKGIEVLFFYEALDEFMLTGMSKYKDWEFKSIEKAEDKDLEAFPDKEEDTPKAAPLSADDESAFDSLLARMKDVLGDKVEKVIISSRLADSPALLASADGVTSVMDKFMRTMSRDTTPPVKTLEVNREHPLLRSMLRIYKADANDAVLASMINALFDAAQLMDGYLRDPQELASRNTSLLEQSAAWYAEIRKL